MSYLTQSESELWDAIVVGLEGEGFDYNPLTTTRSQYLATALGEPTAYLRKSFAQLAAEVNADFGGSMSYLTSSVAHLLDDLATNIGAGGGGDAYVADAVNFAAASYLTTTGEITATYYPDGFVSVWRKIASDDNSIVLNSTGGQLHIEWKGLSGFDFAAYSELGGDFFTGTVNGLTLDTGWHHLLVAWNMDFAAASRKFAIYIDDAPVVFMINDDEGIAFDIWIGDGDHEMFTTMLGAAADWSDGGLWIGQNIVETDSTITEVNRRKFIDAAGKPVDPTTWPASPLFKFVGDATGFVVNQGSAGAVTVTGDAPTNASTSPSD